MKNILIIILTIINIGCSSLPAELYSPTTADQLNKVNYGMKYSDVLNLLKHPGKPMFKFWVRKNEYYMTLYRPAKNYIGFLFLYENESLVSIVAVNSGILIWNKYFGEYSKTLPDYDEFTNIVNQLKKSKIELHNTFYELKEFKGKYGYGAAMAEMSLSAFWILPGVAEILVPAGMVVNSIENVSPYENKGIIEIKSSNYYADLLKKYGFYGNEDTVDTIENRLGSPSIKNDENNIDVLMYSDQENIVYGFVGKKLVWIAFDYRFGSNKKD